MTPKLDREVMGVNEEFVEVPRKLLLTEGLKPITKLLWALIWAQHPITVDDLSSQLGLKARAVSDHAAKLIEARQVKYLESRSLTVDSEGDGAESFKQTVHLYLPFLKNTAWPIAARVLHSAMKAKARSKFLVIKEPELATQAGVCLRTARDHLSALIEAGFIEAFGPNDYQVHDPLSDLVEQQLVALKEYIENDPNGSKGERLMKAYLNELTGWRIYEDNAPIFASDLEKPLEADRLYYTNTGTVVCEFNGLYHYYYNEKFHKSPEQFDRRLYLDQLKKELCEVYGFGLIVVRPRDLSEERMRELISPHLLLRAHPRQTMLDWLNKTASSYVEWAVGEEAVLELRAKQAQAG